jgi:hypothetical protein
MRTIDLGVNANNPTGATRLHQKVGMHPASRILPTKRNFDLPKKSVYNHFSIVVIKQGVTMNIRCAFCQTPYTIGRIEKLDALQHVYANNLTHYDAHCPRCRRATPVLRQKLEMTMPNWRDALKELEAEMTAHPQQEAPLPAPVVDPVPQTESKPEHRTRTGKAVKEEPKPVEAPKAEKKPAKEKPAAKPKETTSKPTATKKPATKKAK